MFLDIENTTTLFFKKEDEANMRGLVTWIKNF